MKTLDQQRAEFAWKRVSEARSSGYAALAKSMPALVMNSGLMQTLAFLEGKHGGEHKLLLGHILEWLREAGVLATGNKAFQPAMKELFAMDSLGYQRATEEALAILRWIRHLADAVVSEKGDDEHGY